MNKHERWLRKALSTDVTRPNLHYIHRLSDDRVFATDGHRAHVLPMAYMGVEPAIAPCEAPPLAKLIPTSFAWESAPIEWNDLAKLPVRRWAAGFGSAGTFLGVWPLAAKVAEGSTWIDARYLGEAVALGPCLVRGNGPLEPVVISPLEEKHVWMAIVMPTRM